MSHPRQVFRREVILDRVWGYDFAGETNLVDVHIGHLRDKLDDRPPRLIQTVRGVGYMWQGGKLMLAAWQNLSLRLRLTLLYVGLLSVLLVALGSFLYFDTRDFLISTTSLRLQDASRPCD